MQKRIRFFKDVFTFPPITTELAWAWSFLSFSKFGLNSVAASLILLEIKYLFYYLKLQQKQKIQKKKKLILNALSSSYFFVMRVLR